MVKYTEIISDGLTLIIDYKFGKITSKVVNNSNEVVKYFSEKEILEGVQVDNFNLKVRVIKRAFLIFPKIEIYMNGCLMKSSDTHEETVIRNIFNLCLIFLICPIVLLIISNSGLQVNPYVLAGLKAFTLFVDPFAPSLVQLLASVAVSTLFVFYIRKHKIVGFSFLFLLLLESLYFSFVQFTEISLFFVILRLIIMIDPLYMYCSLLIQKVKNEEN